MQDKTKEDVQAIFNQIDKDGNGYIEKEEIQQLAIELGVELTQEKLAKIVHVIDTNGDGKISFDEFYEYFLYGVQKNLDKLLNLKFKHIKNVKKFQKKLTQELGHIFDKNIEEGRSLAQLSFNVGQVEAPKTSIDFTVRVGQENKNFTQSLLKHFPLLDDNVVQFIFGFRTTNPDVLHQKLQSLIEEGIELASNMAPEEYQGPLAAAKDALKIEYKALPDQVLVRLYLDNEIATSTIEQYRGVSSMLLTDASSAIFQFTINFLVSVGEVADAQAEPVINQINKGFNTAIKLEVSSDILKSLRQLYSFFMTQENQQAKVLAALAPLILLDNARLDLSFETFQDFAAELGLPAAGTIDQLAALTKPANIKDLLQNVPFVGEFIDALKEHGTGHSLFSLIASEASITLQDNSEGGSLLWEKLI
ncbi:hypothetical protein pb186bvf_020215 [Paramecium bursaria]